MSNPDNFELFDDLSKEVNKEKEYVREVGSHKYQMTVLQLNGEQFEDLTISCLEQAGGYGSKFNKLIIYELKKLSLKSLAGKPYEAGMDREMQPWMSKDVNDFYTEYITGNL